MVRQDQSGWETHPKGNGFKPCSGSSLWPEANLWFRAWRPNRYFFKRSDRTNQDEKITLEFKPCSGSKLIFDQRPICDSRPEGQAWFFRKIRQDQSKGNEFEPCSGPKSIFWPEVNFIQGLKTMINFRKVRQDQSGWEKSPLRCWVQTLFRFNFVTRGQFFWV